MVQYYFYYKFILGSNGIVRRKNKVKIKEEISGYINSNMTKEKIIDSITSLLVDNILAVLVHSDDEMIGVSYGNSKGINAEDIIYTMNKISDRLYCPQISEIYKSLRKGKYNDL